MFLDSRGQQLVRNSEIEARGIERVGEALGGVKVNEVDCNADQGAGSLGCGGFQRLLSYLSLEYLCAVEATSAFGTEMDNRVAPLITLRPNARWDPS